MKQSLVAKAMTLAAGSLLSVVACGAAELIPNTLPAGYRQVEYVSFPMGSTVDTGLAVENVQISTKFDVLSTYYENMHVFGSHGGGRYAHFTEYNKTWYWGVKGTENNALATCAWVGGVHELVYGELGTGDVKLDGQKIGEGAAENGTAGYTLMLGSRGSGDNVNFVGRIYSFAVTNANGAAVLDLVPAIRENDLMAGFYDRVSGRFLFDSTHRLNAALSYREYEVLAGVRVMKGAYFDTGVPVNDYEIRMDYSKDNYVSDCHMFGSAANARNTHFTEWGNRFACGVTNLELKSDVLSPWPLGRHNLIYSKTDSETGDIVFDGKVLFTGTFGHTTAGQSLLLCARQYAVNSFNNYGNRQSQSANFEGEIYSFAMTNRAGVGVLDLVPCRRREDGVVGFYDRVSSRFVTARGNSVPGAVEDMDAYEEIPYVTFSLGTYIDLGFRVAGEQITMKFETPYVSDRHMFGQGLGGRYTHFTEFSDKWYWGLNGTEANSGSIAWTAGLHEVVFAELGTGNIKLDGKVIGTGAAGHSTGDRNLLIGSRSNNHNFAGDIYSFAITNADGTAKVDLVPRRRVSDNAIGFLDRVSGKFYVPANNGSITAKMPTDRYEPVECVSFPVNGGFLDTGLAVPTGAEVRVRFEADYLLNRHIIGQEINSKFLHFTAYNDKWFWGYLANGTAEGNSGDIPWKGGVHTLVYPQKGTQNVVLDGQVLGQAVEANTSDRPLLIGSRNGANTFAGKIYSLAVTNNANGACLLDLQPCVRKADGKYGFYDAKTGRFLTSPGLGYRLDADAKTPDFKTFCYLKTNGAYVNTGILPSDRLKLEASYRTSDGVMDQVLYGVRNFGYDCICFIGATQGAYCGPRMGANTGSVSTLKTCVRHTVVSDVNAGSVDGVTLYTGGQTSADAVSSQELRLFATVGNIRESYDARRYNGRCYGFKAWEDGVPVRDFAPAQRQSDGVVGFLDRVTGLFFQSQGGVFAPGPEWEPGICILLK